MIKVRIAPSPTGNLHVGTAQSALYNWLFARQNNGQFFLRIEDTDRERSTKEYEKNIIDSLVWLELDWDGEVKRQSEYNDKYKEALEKLVKSGKVNIKEVTAEEKAELLKEGRKSSSKLYILPIDTSTEPIRFNDIIRGNISVERKNVGDMVIARVPEGNSDEIIFLYNFVVVVDDIDMEITHVIRGEDHISNTPKQLLIYEALGATPPQFAHLPLLLAPDRSKLSKRHGATAVVDYEKDYLPEALLNFFGKLSFTFSSDIIDRQGMLKEFELSKVHKSGAVFDIKKLAWVNGEYIKKLSDDKLIAKLIPQIELAFCSDRLGMQADDWKKYLQKTLPLVRERIKKFSDIKEFEFFFKEPEYGKELLIWKNRSDQEILASLTAVLKLLENFAWNNFDKDKLRKELDALALQISLPSEVLAKDGTSRGLVYWPFRMALTGLKSSPDPVDVTAILGKEKTLERVKNAITKL